MTTPSSRLQYILFKLCVVAPSAVNADWKRLDLSETFWRCLWWLRVDMKRPLCGTVIKSASESIAHEGLGTGCVQLLCYSETLLKF